MIKRTYFFSAKQYHKDNSGSFTCAIGNLETRSFFKPNANFIALEVASRVEDYFESEERIEITCISRIS